MHDINFQTSKLVIAVTKRITKLKHHHSQSSFHTCLMHRRRTTCFQHR